MDDQLPEDKQADRRRVILNAAFECFLQYGFAKTSLDDVAKKAKLSRPLLYLSFKNKEDLFVEAIRDLYKRLIEQARPTLELNVGRKEKLILLYDVLLLKPWARIIKSPSGREFIEEYRRFFPHLDKEYERETLRLLTPIFADKKKAELFMLCVEGLYSDQPTTAVLKKRVEAIIDIFFKD